jgi:deoxycytidylate deaminase
MSSDFAFQDERLWTWAHGLAEHVAKLSKDPSTKVGAAIFDNKRRVISLGYNGLPRGVEDSPARLHDRDTKLKLTLHAEQNALAFATAPLEGSMLHQVRGAGDPDGGQACLLADAVARVC